MFRKINEDDDKNGYSICVMRDDGANVIMYADEIEKITYGGEDFHAVHSKKS